MPPIIMDRAYWELETARAKYRRAYDKGYALSARADSEAEFDRAQAILDRANREYDAAKAAYAAAREAA